MDIENQDDFIIKKYQQEEQIMVQLFVQWCTNHKLNPAELYQRAYPGQLQSSVLTDTIDQADTEELDIDHETLLDVLQMFGNYDLAFIVSEESEKLSKK
ncbi:hypothetical protein A1A1_06822 [Planococcus antarcticus DSM 14505]|uniref:Uncharacterized protein n=1 Tax=Planococcus antarcticus DSM 14505 TaxID=1185653 RepID=A0A1C7DC91_9BACL|nr:hypothetical protein [Planococcus antarcticus]ANU09037.1 hypothetical protein BBH88_01140 [Planococcus antarcticus DSM 14505]EIM07289.1 hypothetical protein A1A1_06822 [Planococcus antarcticus DSM 14505]